MKKVKEIREIKSKVKEIKNPGSKKLDSDLIKTDKNLDFISDEDSSFESSSRVSSKGNQLSFRPIPEQEREPQIESMREENEERVRTSAIYSDSNADPTQNQRTERKYAAPEGIRGNDLQSSNNSSGVARSAIPQRSLMQQNASILDDPANDLNNKYSEKMDDQNKKTRRRYPWEA
ncbi:MAG: hypothetical protein AABY05_02570 [Nanoarchaeota archaeon]